MESQLTKKIRQKIKKNNGNVWRLHPKNDVDRLYVKRKEGGRGLISVEQCIKEEKTVQGSTLLTRKKTLYNMREAISSVEFRKQNAKELKESGAKNECTKNLQGKQRRKLLRKKCGNGYQEVV